PIPPSPNPPRSPRQAFFASKRQLPTAQAVGQICAETICPYPPGIPALLPGELISSEAITYLQTILRAGGLLTGCSDPSLETLLVVKT
ncbi:MAG: arginine decarboxylase, partial [Phormidesmis sp.]